MLENDDRNGEGECSDGKCGGTGYGGGVGELDGDRDGAWDKHPIEVCCDFGSGGGRVKRTGGVDTDNSGGPI